MINIRIFVHKPNIKKHEYKWEMFDLMIEFQKPCQMRLLVTLYLSKIDKRIT